MRKQVILFFCLVIAIQSNAQEKRRMFSGMYIQWGYNKEWYTRSNVRISAPNGTDFTLHKVKAHDRPDLDAIVKKPGDISIPQYNYRIGFYLNKKRTSAIELNFDHAKYIITDYQTVKVTGTIEGMQANGDSVLNPATFLHMEHTDGANWLHVNYVRQHTLKMKADGNNPFVNVIWKAGAGINIPRTDFTWKGDRLNNDFHIAGYNFGVESGVRIYPSKRFFIEGTAKTGYVRYINALANSHSLKGVRAKHGFGYLELIGLIGYDIAF